MTKIGRVLDLETRRLRAMRLAAVVAERQERISKGPAWGDAVVSPDGYIGKVVFVFPNGDFNVRYTFETFALMSSYVLAEFDSMRHAASANRINKDESRKEPDAESFSTVREAALAEAAALREAAAS